MRRQSSQMGPSPPRTKMSVPLTATLPRAPYHQADEPTARQEVAPALRYLEGATFDEAKFSARAVYLAARQCVRCRRVLAQRFDRLGSTLFRDDDPHELACCFDPADGDACTVRLLAACIVLFGRNRENVY